MELQGRVGELRKQGYGLAGISYDSQEILADFSKRHGITFPLLSDVGSVTIKRYGILNTVAEEALGPHGKNPEVLALVRVFATANEPAERHRGIPFPGTFMVDRDGRVTSRFFEDSYRERNTVSAIMLRLGTGGAPVQARQVSTSHLELKTYASDTTIAPGNHFSLVLDITPRARMHVYAPGASGYRIIKLDLTPQPYVRLLPLSYPASEIYYFAPLKERVPVYQQPFTLVREIVPEATPEAQKALTGKGALTIAGTLEYQACDDKICFNPVSLPLSWTVAVHGYVPGAQRPGQGQPGPQQPAPPPAGSPSRSQ